MAEAKINTTINRPNSSSPEPNCAICLGHCTNKCFSDSCLHQFCFKCLLEWSKIKAECPLCKQPFKSIIHNVKSNTEYDEHVVENIAPEEIRIIDNEQFYYLPQPARHQFHFRTTFTVDTRGEHAIQQMLLSHPLTSGGISISNGYPRGVYTRSRRDPSATRFRRSIYTRNLWVSAPPDVTGRYRDVTPSFYRDCPGARTRLVPWLNRELNVLLYENTQLVMHLVDIILEQLLRHHICSSTFRAILCEYLGNETDHFVHEFYNFMRSPFDMIGYDRHIIYLERPTSPAPFIDVSDNDSDSDVILVSATNPNEPVVIDLVNTDSDEPILVSEQPAPEPTQRQAQETETRSPILPLKLRLKLKHRKQTREKRLKKKWRHRRSRSSSSSSSSSSRSSDSSSSSSSTTSTSSCSTSNVDEMYKYKIRRRLFKKKPKGKRRRVASTEVCEIPTTDSEDVPLSTYTKKKHKKHSKRKHLPKNPQKSYMIMSPKGPKRKEDLRSPNQPSCSKESTESKKPQDSSNGKRLKKEPPIEVPRRTDMPSCSRFPDAIDNTFQQPQNSYRSEPSTSVCKKETNGSDSDNRFPAMLRANGSGIVHDPKDTFTFLNDQSNTINSGRLRNILIKKEESSNTWFSYPCNYNSDTSEC